MQMPTTPGDVMGGQRQGKRWEEIAAGQDPGVEIEGAMPPGDPDIRMLEYLRAGHAGSFVERALVQRCEAGMDGGNKGLHRYRGGLPLGQMDKEPQDTEPPGQHSQTMQPAYSRH